MRNPTAPAPCLKPHKMRCLAFAPVLRGEAEPCEACAPHLEQTRAILGDQISVAAPVGFPELPVLIRQKAKP